MKAKTPQAPSLPQRLSLVDQTAQSLRDGISSGHWQSHLPGERELCAHLQVGRNTLRAALQELERGGWLEVVQGQRRRIKAQHAAPKPSGQKRVIGILCPSPFIALPPLAALTIDSLREMLTKADCAMEFHVNRACFSAKPAQALGKLVRHHPAIAWLLFTSTEAMQNWFVQRRLPCLVVGSCARGITLPSIDSDHRAVCRHAGGLLLRKGHRRIAIVLPQHGQAGDSESELGLREALETAPDAQLRVLRHDGTTGHLCSLLDAAISSPNPPTAFLVARAMHVLTALMHLMRRGKRIPQDVAVISRDDDPFLQSTSPFVTRYAINPILFARRVSLAARRLAETGTLELKAIRIIPKFVPGETL